MKNNMLFFVPLSVNPFFLEDGVKTISTSLFFLHRLKYEMKIHRPSVNRFDGVILQYDFDNKNESENHTIKLLRDRRDQF